MRNVTDLPDASLPWCVRLAHVKFRRPSPKLKLCIPIMLLVILGCTAVLFVGFDVIEKHLFPTISTGFHHALLTVWAFLVASIAFSFFYMFMRCQQRQLTNTADQLTRLLESYQKDPSAVGRFENPHLVHCREVLHCNRPECPMFDSTNERCWQVMALKRSAIDELTPRIEIERCLKCDVYRISCPDKLTELGESFNNLMFLLEAEAEQVGRLRAQMAEKEKMVAIGQIAAGIAHEVGNPLSSISSIVQVLKRSRSDVTTADQLDLIETHIQRISATVRRFVNLARPVHERWELVDLGHALEDVVHLIAFDRRARNVEINFERPNSLPRSYGLRGQLQQVFLNLALNALDAMPNGGKLTIFADQKDGSIRIHVRDTGSGITPEIKQHIFEPFFTTKKQGEGTGLGLAVSVGIIQKHHGTIDFSSALGAGTEFIVDIPVQDKVPDA